MKNKSFLKSLRHARDGVRYTFKNERNFRIDIAVMLYVIWFSCAYGLSRTEWAVVVILIGMMLVCEIINTAVERAVDTATADYDVNAKAAKDAAAAAPLVFAAVSVVGAIFIFLDFERIAAALYTIFHSVIYIASFAVITLINVFIVKKRS